MICSRETLTLSAIFTKSYVKVFPRANRVAIASQPWAINFHGYSGILWGLCMYSLSCDYCSDLMGTFRRIAYTVGNDIDGNIGDKGKGTKK